MVSFLCLFIGCYIVLSVLILSVFGFVALGEYLFVNAMYIPLALLLAVPFALLLTVVIYTDC